MSPTGPEPARRRPFATRVPESPGILRASGSFGFRGNLGLFVRTGHKVCRASGFVWRAARIGFVRVPCGKAFGAPGPIGPRRAHDTAPALTMAPCPPGLFTGRADVPPRGGLSVADYGNLFNPDS
jgi:hypothetical protein